MTLERFLLTAAVSLVLLALAFVVCAWRSRGPEDSFFLALLRATAWSYVRIVHRLRVESPTLDPIPATGAFIVVANHRSGLDPVVLSVATLRRVRFLMAREYYELPVLRHVFRALQSIPVSRDGADVGATKEALRALRAGQVIGIFPQGGIREPGTPMEGKEGIALLALRSKAPLIPFYLEGSPNLESVFRAVVTPSRTVIHAGAPIEVESEGRRKASRDELERITTRVLAAVSALAPPPPSPPRAR